MRKIVLVIFLSISITGFSQELNCNVVVNAQQTGDENLQVFKTLEKQLKEFVNNTQWTNKKFLPQERIDCSMFINILKRTSDIYIATIQVVSSRPVYGSTYNTPIYNINDEDFTFRYIEFQNFTYNVNQFESNLVSVLAFHINMFLGLDADSFSPNGGDDYFKQAQTIVNYSQQENSKGWKLEDGLQSRYILVDNILSPTFKDFRTIIYTYHMEGIDIMNESPKDAKINIASSLKQLQAMNSRRPNSFLMRTFFDAKADEIEQIFSSGPNVEITSLLSVLNKVAPMYSSNWRNIKF